MRCDLAAALLPAPPILFLDEPTIGLDAPSKLAVRDFVMRLNRERGVTVIIGRRMAANHHAEEARRQC